MRRIILLAALAALVLPVVAAASTSSTTLFVEQHIYTDYVKLDATFYAPQRWANCSYGFCDYPDVDYSVRLYQTHNGRQRLVTTYRDAMFVSDGVGEFSWEVFVYDLPNLYCPGTPNYYRWVVTTFNPYGETFTTTSGRFYRYCK